MLRTCLAVVCAFIAGAAHAQSYPFKPIRVVVASTPGGGADLVARLIAPTTGDVPVHCSVVPRSGPVLRHVRADLLETTFTGREA